MLPERRYAGAAPADIRARNRAAVLRCLYPETWRSRAQIAGITGLSKVSVSEVVSELIADGLIVEGGYKTSSRPGKPALMLGFRAQSRCVLAVDLSGIDVITGVVSDMTGHVRERLQVPMPCERSDGSDKVEAVLRACENLQTQAGCPVLGIGVATPGAVTRSGEVREASNLGWSSVELAQSIRQRCSGLPVYVLNDADSAALGERHFGNGAADSIVVQIAGGVGAGMLVADHIVHGPGFTAGEIGHVVVEDEGIACRCGKRGCLETIASATVIHERMKGLPTAQRDEVLRQSAQVLGKALSMPVGMTDISDVVVLAPDDVATDGFIESMENAINERVHSRFLDNITVRRPQRGADVVVLGAVAAVLRRELDVM